jgi:hypothetical protein
LDEIQAKLDSYLNKPAVMTETTKSIPLKYVIYACKKPIPHGAAWYGFY